ncbi:hypothetical protein [Roseiflexus sp. RS-1]|jgi:hypothetical protein|uniref:hypothetical protein n=1 Tax=Roseiflexus sp. (strain RS-1) TaxID=357808 RepID=UPI0002D8FDD4|nr:hypothetical protein [Roseiflexus sp. RS-1]
MMVLPNDLRLSRATKGGRRLERVVGQTYAVKVKRRPHDSDCSLAVVAPHLHA